MRVYISGPMTGCPQNNISAFLDAAVTLQNHDHQPVNPVYISAAFGTDDELRDSFAALYGGSDDADADLARAVMDADLAAVRSCDAIYLLRGWENSRGAKQELAEALKHNLIIMQEGGERD